MNQLQRHVQFLELLLWFLVYHASDGWLETFAWCFCVFRSVHFTAVCLYDFGYWYLQRKGRD